MEGNGEGELVRLGVNIDHVATLRQARGTSYPDVLEAARICELAGAHGITIHLREDRRHIQDADVIALRSSISTRMNLELANVPEIVKIALEVHPDEVCIVPERREELTTEGGLDAAGHLPDLKSTCQMLRDAGIDVSLFVEPSKRQIEAAFVLGVPYVELHTGTYCDASGARADEELECLMEGARMAHSAGLRVNAGHGLNMDNIANALRIPFLDTLNIGHSIVARALTVGMEQAVKEMRQCLSAYSGGEE